MVPEQQERQQVRTQEELGDTLSTYRHLRLALVILLGMLLFAVILRALTSPGDFCLEGSISAYYFTSVRAMFVGVLCAIGTCLIVYRGNTNREDIALNASGALAFVVALVPAGAPSAVPPDCTADNVPTAALLQAATNNNMFAFIVAGLAALVVAGFLLFRSTRLGFAPKAAIGVFGVVLLAGTVLYGLRPAGFREHAHLLAAIGTFAAIVLVVAFNARGSKPGIYRKLYQSIAWAMGLTGAVILVAIWVTDDWDHAVFFAEFFILAEFLVFWVVQTSELWRRTRRDAPEIVLAP